MEYEIKPVHGIDDAVTITCWPDEMMRVVTVESAPGEFVQRAVMRRAMAKRVVGALKLADRIAATVAEAQ